MPLFRFIYIFRLLLHRMVILPAVAVCIIFLFNGNAYSASVSFPEPVVIPISTWVYFDTDERTLDPEGPKDDYQIRYVELLSPTTLGVTAAYKGIRGPKDTSLLIDLKQVNTSLVHKRPVSHILTLYTDYLEDEGSPCHDVWEGDLQKVPNITNSLQTLDGYVSPEYYELNEKCFNLAAIADYVKEFVPTARRVNYNPGDRSIELHSDGKKFKYRLDLDGGLEIADQGLGVVGKRYPTSLNVEVVSLEIKNSFFGVFALDQAKSARLLLGPEQTSSNLGFVPRSLSLAPSHKPWMAYIGPQEENWLWGISVWEISDAKNQARRIASLATGRLAYSEHRGFDHSVNWTGPDSIIYLEDDELTLTHVRVMEGGKSQTLGRFSFQKGHVFSAAGEVLGSPWKHDFELFRLEAISALPIKKDRAIRVVCVAVLSHNSEEGSGQVALPLIIDLPWNLQ